MYRIWEYERVSSQSHMRMQMASTAEYTTFSTITCGTVHLPMSSVRMLQQMGPPVCFLGISAQWHPGQRRRKFLESISTLDISQY